MMAILTRWLDGLTPLELVHLHYDIDQIGKVGDFPPHVQRVWERYTLFKFKRQDIQDRAEYNEAYDASCYVFDYLVSAYVRHLESQLDIQECTCREDRAQACPVCRARIAAQGDEIPFSEKG